MILSAFPPSIRPTNVPTIAQGLQRMNTPEEFWDNSASSYDKNEERFAHIHSKSRGNAKKYLNGSDTVLDYGCGTGATACELAKHVKEIHAVDISTNMIEAAKKKADVSSIANIGFARADIFDDAYEAASFDAVLAFNVLHTVPNPAKVLQRMYELLKPSGVVISVTPCLRDKMSPPVHVRMQIVRILCKTGIIPIPIRRITGAELDDLVRSANFHIIDSETIYDGVCSRFVVAKKMQEIPADNDTQDPIVV